ncbi:hypothetical protein BDQ12DRAFT_416891 [Crucibulum laeve]|uniref:Ino eighty subunit 1 n=1 Tax=Crucibulum laeve TaxID=68775 RepID=A0A5C3M6J9_9AGAR|nr:hypothetical protein BDQ12DRAFT_416891 [Crucibulum laeve]
MASTSTGNTQAHGKHPSWPPEPIPPVGYLSRKALPIKRNDAEPLTRDDVQFDLLNYIFLDTNAVFTNPTPGKNGSKTTFHDLYISALYNSTKCSKVLKDKMIETPAFAVELAKISLLTNVGRINTTMAFFPEMKTALRTYHPVPSLQKTDGNAQDAPRIKNCLKAALLPSEFKSVPPSTPEEILEKNKAGQRPPTSVVNLIFVLANHAAPLASVHFDGALNFLDLFLPNKRLSSTDRARAFLWLVYYYLEDSNSTNPFDDDYSKSNPGKAPLLRHLNDAELKGENVDTPEELDWGRMMSNQRNAFLQRLVSSIEYEKKAKSSAPHFVSAVPETGHRKRTRHFASETSTKDEGAFLYYVPSKVEPTPSRNMIKGHGSEIQNTATTQEERTLLQQAWHIVTTTDPLIDSDEEDADQNARLDYTRRLDVINRLRGRPPTPARAPAENILGRDASERQRTSSWN